jgi:hypothetical protein
MFKGQHMSECLQIEISLHIETAWVRLLNYITGIVNFHSRCKHLLALSILYYWPRKKPSRVRQKQRGTKIPFFYIFIGNYVDLRGV